MAKGSPALKWIVREAKRLRREYPKRFIKWTDYVAQASAIYASKHKGKSPVGKKRRHKKVSGVRTVSRSHTDKNRITANIQVGSISSHKAAIRKRLEERLQREMMLHYYGNKVEKRKFSKKIRETKRELKKYC